MKTFIRTILLLSAFFAAFETSLPVFASGGGGHEKKEKKKAAAPKKQRPITSLESWVMVDPFNIAIIQTDEVRGKLSVSFGMDVPDEQLRLRAETIMPRLQDAWLTQLSHYASTSLRPKYPADIAAVSDLLQSTADRILEKPGSKVLIAAVIVEMK